MTLRNELKNKAVAVFIYINSILTWVKIYFGLLQVKHSIPGAFEERSILLSSLLHTEKRVKACQEYDNFRADDVILFTYPKSGTHFTAEIIAAVYKEGGLRANTGLSGMTALEAKPPAIMHGSKRGAGKSEMSDLDAAESPRLIVTHLPWDFMPQKVKDGKVKVIHCMRNPKDVLCSMFPFMKKMRALLAEVSWSDYVPLFIQGHVLYGSYFKYLQQWYPNRDMESMLNLHFEEMKRDLGANVRKIASFLKVDLTEEQIDRIVVANTFENKKKEMGNSNVFYRKGKSGGWKSELTVEQNEMMDEWIKEEMQEMMNLNLQYQ